jgi:hypothetical protein
MNNYVDKIMSNHVFNSESSEDLYYLYSDENRDNKKKPSNNKKSLFGGAADLKTDYSNDTDDRPTGGFPPIYIISAKEKEVDLPKNRQLAPIKATISIKDILKSKK